ncbi:ATP-dependent Clp protease ATP-binding subunit ClpA [Endozoicomonas sp. NE41]
MIRPESGLAQKGYDRQMGARPMGRTIQEHLKKPMAEQILFGKLSENGGFVRVTVKKDELHLKFEAAKSKTSGLEIIDGK